jgi:chromosome segregation ATPase
MIATHVPKPTFYWSSKIQYHQEKLIEIEHEQERVKSELLKLNEKWNSRHHQLQEARKASINPKGKFVHVEENPRVLSKEGP